MGENSNGDGVANTPSGDSRSLNLIRSWDDCPIVAPEVLREWIAEEVAKCKSEVQAFREKIPELRDGRDAEKLRWLSIAVTEGPEFIKLAGRAEPLLSDDIDPYISIAFTTGLRLGLIYKRLQSLRDKTASEKWVQQDKQEAGGRATKVLTSDSDVAALKRVYNSFRGKPKIYLKVANELFYGHDIKSRRGEKLSEKTIERRIKELKKSGELDNA